MRRIAALGGVVAALALASTVATAAAAQAPVMHFPQQATLGFYRGHTVEYLDFGPVKLAKGNHVEPIWAFTNGADGQQNIIDTVPGSKNYSPLWAVRMVTWKDGMTPHVVRSAAEVLKAIEAGEATVKNTQIVVNCPLI
jgi:hypothetical protein